MMDEKPKRIQRKRTKGWKMPENTISVTRPGKWGNPFEVGGYYMKGDMNPGIRLRMVYTRAVSAEYADRRFTKIETAEQALEWYRWYLAQKYDSARANNSIEYAAMMNELEGHNLACWCKLCEAHKDGRPLGVECRDCEPCHADVLLRLANPA